MRADSGFVDSMAQERHKYSTGAGKRGNKKAILRLREGARSDLER